MNFFNEGKIKEAIIESRNLPDEKLPPQIKELKHFSRTNFEYSF